MGGMIYGYARVSTAAQDETGQVRQLKAAGWEGELDENTYYIDYDAGFVYIRQSPRGHLVEITAFDCALNRTNGECRGRASDHKGPTIRGLTPSARRCS